MKSEITCILCGSEANPYRVVRARRYYKCGNCSSVVMDPDDYVTLQQEKARYETHNNDVNDPGYQEFVTPITEKVLDNHGKQEYGLDYGSGTGPVITKLLRDRGYRINTYDPFFDGDWSLLEHTYHYIVCCEVVEHFHKPSLEFRKLRELLKPGGSLYCMTQLFDSGIDFDSWSYKNDETHVIFYHPRALEWIRIEAGFASLDIHNGRLFTLKA